MAAEKKLLVLFDGSERARQTLEYLGQLTPFKKFKLVLFHVFTGVPDCFCDIEKTPHNQETVSQLIAWENQQRKEIDNFAQKIRQNLVDNGFSENSVEIKIQKRQTGVARDILKEAKEGYYTAVVLRRQGVGALEGIMIGSIANKIFSKLTFCPLIIAGPQPANEKLLIAIDGSPSSMESVDFVANNLSGSNFTIGLVHVIRGFGGLVPDTPEFLMPAKNMELAHNEMMDLFSSVKEKLIHSGFDGQRIKEKIITGVYSRAAAIVKEASDGEYGTIVIGRKGLSKVREFYMGRVCNKVIQIGNQFSVWVI